MRGNNRYIKYSRKLFRSYLHLLVHTHAELLRGVELNLRVYPVPMDVTKRSGKRAFDQSYRVAEVKARALAPSGCEGVLRSACEPSRRRKKKT